VKTVGEDDDIRALTRDVLAAGLAGVSLFTMVHNLPKKNRNVDGKVTKICPKDSEDQISQRKAIDLPLPEDLAVCCELHDDNDGSKQGQKEITAMGSTKRGSAASISQA
jgi:hypothetical protein